MSQATAETGDRRFEQGLLIPQGFLDELNVSAEEFAEAWKKGGRIEELRAGTLTMEDLSTLMRGGTVTVAGVDLTMHPSYNPTPSDD